MLRLAAELVELPYVFTQLRPLMPHGCIKATRDGDRNERGAARGLVRRPWLIRRDDEAAPALEDSPASFAGASALVVLFQWHLAPVREDLPLLLRAALLPLVLLSSATYLVMPFARRLLHGWLYPKGEHGR